MKIIAGVIAGVWLVAQVGLAVNPTEIDFHWNFKQRQAQGLFESKKYPEAQAALEQLATTAPTAAAKLDCLSLAAIALAHQKQVEPALAKAKAIADPTMADYTRLEILAAAGQRAELIAAFKDRDFATWPETIAFQAFMKRGEAHEAGQNLRAAVIDFERAAERVPPKGASEVDLRVRVGALHEKLGEPDKALEIYCRVLTLVEGAKKPKGGMRDYPRAVQSAARLLVGKKQYDEALAVLAKYDPSLSRTWGVTIPEMAGDIHVTLKQTDKAAARYREALANAGDQAKHVTRINKKLDSL
jgi:predicted negative regulator of RcsB-dependent stress response